MAQRQGVIKDSITPYTEADWMRPLWLDYLPQCYKWDRAIMLQETLANLDSDSQYPRAEEACERVSLIIVAITRTSVSFPGTTYWRPTHPYALDCSKKQFITRIV